MGELPESVQLIADVIGEDLALQLVDKLPRCGNRRGHPQGEPVLYVPKTIAPDHRIATIVGMPAAVKLSRMFGGDLLFLATCANRRRNTRNDEILDALKSATPAVVAGRFQVSERQVRRIVARARTVTTPMGCGVARANTPPQSLTAIAA